MQDTLSEDLTRDFRPCCMIGRKAPECSPCFIPYMPFFRFPYCRQKGIIYGFFSIFPSSC